MVQELLAVAAALPLALAAVSSQVRAQDEAPGVVAPPPGGPADEALWLRGQQAGEAVVASRAEAGRLQQRVKVGRLAERLEQAGAGAPAGLRERLLAQWLRNYELVSRPWPIDPTRVCWYPMLAFDSALRAAPAGGQGEVGQARAELEACVGRAELAVQAMAESNAALAAVAGEAERALPAAAAPPAGGG